MKKLFHCTVCAVFTAAILLGCKHRSDNKPAPDKPVVHNIIVQANVNGEFEDAEKAIPASGIPYTATHKDITPTQNITVKASVKALALEGKQITAKITKPADEAEQPLTIVDKGGGMFEVAFKKVTKPVNVKILFEIEGNVAKRSLEFKVLPEPEITGVKCAESEYIFGKGFKFQLKPEFSLNPEKIGKADSSVFLLNSSKKIAYESSEESAVTVDTEGMLTTHNPGTSNIKMKTVNGKEATVKITVENQISPESLNFSAYAVNLKKGDTKEITVTAQPANGSIELTGWSNSSPSVGNIEEVHGSNNKYKITALANGETIFTTKAKYNTGIEVKISLTVSDEIVQSVTVDPVRVTLEKGGTKHLTAKIMPQGAPAKVRWESSDEKKVTVDNSGLVTAKGDGVAIIKAFSLADSTKFGTCVVTVAAAAGEVTLNKELLELTYNESFTLTASIVPPEAPQDVQWSVDDSNLLSYTSGGVITAKSKKGKAVVTATSKADPSKKSQCTVYIAQEKVTGITVSEAAFTMDTNGEKNFTVTVAPSSATADIETEIESENLELIKCEKQILSNTYDCTVKTGNFEETKKIIFSSRANPEIKAEVTITTKAPQVQSVSVENKTISLDQLNEKMTAVVLPANAVQTVTWESSDQSIVMIDPESGVLTPIKAGQANVTATSTSDISKKGTAQVTVKAGITGFEVAISGTSVYYGSPATITVTPAPADGFGDFEVSTENKDLEISPVAGNNNEFTVSVKNKAAEKQNDIAITVKSNVKPSLPAKTVTVNIQTIVPASLKIKSSDPNGKMYKDEELTLSIADDYSSITDKSVTWSIKGFYNYRFAITEDGKLTLKDNNAKEAVTNGTTVTVVATSKVKDSLKAEKEITVYNNIAVIQDVTCNMKEYTLGNWHKPNVDIDFTESIHVTHRNFIITDRLYISGEPSSDYLEKVLFTNVSLLYGVEISPKSHTYGQAKTFYVYPVDPKTGKAVSSGKKSFSLTVWQKAEGIELEKGNFEIIKLQSGGYDIKANNLTHNRPAESYYFYAKIIPEYANPLLLSVKKIRNEGALHTITPVLEDDGRTKISFGTHRSGLGVAEEDTLQIYLNDGVKTTLKVKIN